MDILNKTNCEYKLVSRDHKKENSVISINGVSTGDGSLTIVGGPCTIESRDQLFNIANNIKDNIHILRAGAFKPRTSPYSFQGLGEEGLKLLSEVKKEINRPTISEIMDINDLKYFEDVDILQVGSRNMQNFSLLKALGNVKKPILLKRHFAATIDEFLSSAEYIVSNGNENVILCERGIRSFDSETRFTLDLSIVPILKEKTHLPVWVDPSHACGRNDLIAPMAKAAVACGCDGLMIEVHNDRKNALCDGAQALTIEEFNKLSPALCSLKEFIG